MTTKPTGLDTLKVLAMSIKPGQELVAVGLEGQAKRTWYSDHCTNEPDQVYVKGPQNVIRQLLAIATKHDHEIGAGDGFHVWGFPSRSTADSFVTIVRTFEALSFWQVGLSRQYAMVSEHPLLGYFTAADSYRFDVSKEAARTERMRVLAYELLHKDFARRIGVSVVFVTESVMKAGELTLPKETEVSRLDWNQPAPTDSQQLAYVSADRRGKRETVEGTIHYCFFGVPAEANAYFAAAVSRGTGTVWHFAIAN